VERLRDFLTDDRPTLAALALKFCLSYEAVSTVIVGMRRVESNCAVSDGILLTQDERQALAQPAFVHGWKYPWSRELD
jgi:aryl-alcohol dehydrogenase-like predicted oxidoreductase